MRNPYPWTDKNGRHRKGWNVIADVLEVEESPPTRSRYECEQSLGRYREVYVPQYTNAPTKSGRSRPILSPQGSGLPTDYFPDFPGQTYQDTLGVSDYIAEVFPPLDEESWAQEGSS